VIKENVSPEDMVNRDHTSTYTQYRVEEAEIQAKDAHIKATNLDVKDAKVTSENQIVKQTKEKLDLDADKPQEISAKEMLEIEAAYQEFLKKSDAIAAGYSPRVIDSTAVTAEIFGSESSYKTLKDVHGVDKGFYLVLNVFSVKHYFENFIADLEQRGFEPKFFINPENNYYYVYLQKSDRYITIKNLQRNNVNNTYYEDKWVLWVR